MWNGEVVTVLVNEEGSENKVSAQSPYNETGANITETGTTASGSTLFKLDFFLQPPFYGTDILELGPLYPQFSIVYGMLESTGLFDNGPGILPEDVYVTILAPTDAAMREKYGEGVQQLLESADPAFVQAFLLNHVVLDVYPTVLMETGDLMATEGGSQLTVTKRIDAGNTTIMLGPATIVIENVLARNGLAHGVDKVLGDLPPLVSAPTPSQTPPTAASPAPTRIAPGNETSAAPSHKSDITLQHDPELRIFWQDLNKSGAYEQVAFTEFTAFAPINAALEAFEFMETLRSPSWIAHYRHFMLFHIAVGELPDKDLTELENNTMIETSSGENITVSVAESDKNEIYLSSPSPQNITILESFTEEATGKGYSKIDEVLMPSFMGTDLLTLSDQVNNFSFLADFLERIGSIPGSFLVGVYTSKMVCVKYNYCVFYLPLNFPLPSNSFCPDRRRVSSSRQ